MQVFRAFDNDCAPTPDHRGTNLMSFRSVTLVLLLMVAACHDPVEPTGGYSEPSTAATAAAALWRQVSPGAYHTCGLTADSLAYCWGGSANGELGTGEPAGQNIKLSPAAVQGTHRWRDIQAGHGHTCGLARSGRVFCWGDNFLGKLGDGTTSDLRIIPTAVATTRTFIQVSTGVYHNCAVTATGVAYCWGYNESGQLGDGTRTNRNTPVKVLGNLNFRHVRAAWDHTCGVTTEDVAYCWGGNSVGQLGDGTTLSRTRPVRVKGGHQFRLIRTGESLTCALTPAGRAYCWGYNGTGGIGDGTTVERHLPAAVVNGESFASISVGWGYACGVRKDQTGWCWGRNNSGQLGTGMPGGSLTPVPTAGNLRWQRVNTGESSWTVCGLTTTGAAFCWGENYYGQVGNGTRLNTVNTPSPVQDP
jgi:alpha-tubulin suppressor-like RCC1 family protein